MNRAFPLAALLAVTAALAGADTPKRVQTPSGQPAAYATFRLVRTRNIFDPDRRPLAAQAPPPPVRAAAPPAAADFVALTGTLVTGDKAFAFFTGSRAEFNTVLAVSGTVATFKVTKITPVQVEVNRGGNPSSSRWASRSA